MGWHGTKALVTGASGFVGAAVVRALVKRGLEPRVLVRPESNRRNLSGLNVEFFVGNLTDHGSLKKAVEGVSHLYHVAADYRLWVRNPSDLYRVNVDGTEALMRAAWGAGVLRVVYTSSVAALGLSPDGTPASEETPVRPKDIIGHYKRSKFLAEERVRELVHRDELPAVIVNPSAPVGPGDITPTPTGRMIVEAMKGAMPAYVDTGLNLAHVDDIAEGHLLACEKGEIGERYILGGENLALSDILQEIARIVGRKPPSIRIPHNMLWPVALGTEAWARVRRSTNEPFLTLDGLRMSKKLMFFSHQKAERLLGYNPRPASSALADAVAWFRASGHPA